MKPEKTNIIKIGYIKEKNKYFATFQVLDLDKNEIGKSIRYFKILNHQKDRKLYINGPDLQVTDLFEADSFESMYPYIVESAKQGMIPERLEPQILNREVDLCMMEQNIDFSVRAGANPERYMEILKNVIDD